MPRPTAKQPDVARALNALRRMVRGLRSAAEAVERDVNISAAQLFVLRELERAPDQSVKDLAAVTMTTHSTVSQVVAQLIAKGLVIRTADAVDGRRAVLRISRRGTALLRRAPRAIQEGILVGFARLAASERRSLAKGLEKWVAASGLSGVPSSMLFDKPVRANRKRRSQRPNEIKKETP
jgi:DNA-binding MarR family transcriptional regulator